MQLPEQRRRPLDGGLPLRRHPDGRHLPRPLLAGRPCPGRQRGRRHLPAEPQPWPERALAHRRLYGRRFHQLPQSHGPHPLRRHWLRLQVGHGLDARYAGLLRHPLRPASRRIREDHFQYALFLQRALPAGAEPRRGRPRQKDSHRQALGHLRGKMRPAAHPLFLYVCAPGQKAQFYGQRAGAFPGVGRKAGAGLGPAQVPLPRCIPEIFRCSEPPLRHPACPLRGRV